MRGFERVATSGNKKCGLCLYLIHTFGPIACIKSDVRWYKYIYMYIRIAFSIELRLRVSRSLHSLANYRPSQLSQKPSNGVLAYGDPITPSNTVKYQPSSNTLISTEQRGGVCNIYIYIYMYIRIAFFIELRLRVSRSLRSLANYRPSPLAQNTSNGVLARGDPITPSNSVKYHPSSNTLISTK